MEITMLHCIVLTIALPIVIFFHRFGKEHAFPTASKLSWSSRQLLFSWAQMSTRFAQYGSRQFVIRGPFLLGPGNFSRPKANFEVKTCKLLIVAQFLAHKPVNFASLTDAFILPIFKITETLILNANTENIKQLFGPEKLSGLRETGPTALIITFS